MHEGVGTLAFTLEVLAAHEAAVDVQSIDRDRALLVEVEIQHVPPYLAKVRTEDLFFDLLSLLWLTAPNVLIE